MLKNIKWKRVNRGVVIGIVFLLVGVIYIMSNMMKFNKNKDVIESNFKEYINKWNKTFVVEAKDLDSNGRLKNDVRKEKTEKLKKLVDEYWTDSKIDNYNDIYSNYTSKNDIKAQIDEVFSDEYDANICMSKANISNFKIKMITENIALINLDYNYSAQGKKFTKLMTPFSCDEGDLYYCIYEEWPTELKTKQGALTKEENKKIRELYANKKVIIEDGYDSYYDSVYIYNDNGNWKISDANYSPVMHSSVVADDIKTDTSDEVSNN